MRLYFKRYNKNIDLIYDMKEFYNSDGTMKVDDLEYLDRNTFIASDGATGINVPASLLNSSGGKANFVLVPAAGKIYEVMGRIYEGNDNINLQLIENFVLSNYSELRNMSYKSTRAFPYRQDGSPLINLSGSPLGSFPTMGHDISDISKYTDYNLHFPSGGNIKTRFALLFFKSERNRSDLITLKFRTQRFDEDLEHFDSYSELINKYPNDFESYGKGFPEYTDYKVSVGDPNYPSFYTYIVGSGWEEFNPNYMDEVVIVADRSGYKNPADIDTIIVALPFSQIVKGDYFNTLTFGDFIGPKISSDGGGVQFSTLMDIKIVDSDFLNLKINEVVVSPTQINGDAYIKMFENVEKTEVSPTDREPLLFRVHNFKPIHDVSTSLARVNGMEDDLSGDGVELLEPFNEYYLNIFGNRHRINSAKLGRIKVQFSLSSEAISYNIIEVANIFGSVLGDKVIIDSGRLSNSAFFTTDQKDEFYSQNPMFKSQMNTNLALNSTKSIVGGISSGMMSGAIGGSMGGPIGMGAGAAIGGGLAAVGAIIDVGATHANKRLSDKTLSMRPDKINGNITDTIDLSMTSTYGIYWTVYKNYGGKQEMLLEYYVRGMPVVDYRKVKDSYLTKSNVIIDEEGFMFVSGRLVADSGGLNVMEFTAINDALENGVFIRDYKWGE